MSRPHRPWTMAYRLSPIPLPRRQIDHRREAERRQGIGNLADVGETTGLEHELDFRVLQGQVGEGTLVMHFLDVCVRLGDGCRNARQRPGHIAQAHQPNEWVTLDQLAWCERFMRRLADRICVA